MKLASLKKTARNWKHELTDQVQDRERGEAIALLAWEIVGGLAVLVAVYSLISMMPEMVRYMKIKRM